MIDINKLMGTGALTEGQTYKQILQRARHHIEDPNRWTQRAFARNGMGFTVKPRDEHACCWCLLGSVAFCSNSFGLTPPPLLRYMEDMMKHLYGDRFDPHKETDDIGTIGKMNDYVDHEEVLFFLKACIDNIPD